MMMIEAAKADGPQCAAEVAAARAAEVDRSPLLHMPPFVADALNVGESGPALPTPRNIVLPVDCIVDVERFPSFEVVNFLFRQHCVLFLI